MTEVVVTVPGSLDGVRVDRAVALLADLPRSAVNDLVAKGRISIDGRTVRRRSAVVRPGQELSVETPEEPPQAGPVPDPSVAFAVVHADEAVIVVDKPAGLVVHPGAGHPRGTLVNGLLSRYPELAGVAGTTGSDRFRPGIVHRLDRGTSGLMVVARTPASYRSLVSQLGERTVSRTYLTLVHGSVDGDSGVIEAPIGRSATSPTRMAISRTGRAAVTRYEVEGRFETPVVATLLSVGLETGRTHQIRVHLSAIGHPVVGDDTYGRAKRVAEAALRRPFLHAIRLAFDHPVSGLRRDFSSQLPPDLAGALAELRE